MGEGAAVAPQSGLCPAGWSRRSLSLANPQVQAHGSSPRELRHRSVRQWPTSTQPHGHQDAKLSGFCPKVTAHKGPPPTSTTPHSPLCDWSRCSLLTGFPSRSRQSALRSEAQLSGNRAPSRAAASSASGPDAGPLPAPAPLETLSSPSPAGCPFQRRKPSQASSQEQTSPRRHRLLTFYEKTLTDQTPDNPQPSGLS
uniref:Uncharacterized protein n=1 Tax=Pipistrellus kuhlii TaxID=59472 RepID=A0A7J7TPM5_PIPKU|nr:hypothetical protein mPipKuh1_009313 [Pipistrellus kuhlii]